MEKIKIRSEEIKLVPIYVPVPYEKNMHIHTEAQIDRLAEIIRYQGFRNPIVLQSGTNRIASGHGRLLAAKKLDMSHVPVVYQEFESEEQFYSYVVSDNAIAKDSWAKLDFSQINKDIIDLGPEMNIHMLGIKNFTIEPMEKLSGINKNISPDISGLITEENKDEPETKAIQIDFKKSDYNEAKYLISEFKKKDVYIGKMLIDHLKTHLDTLNTEKAE